MIKKAVITAAGRGTRMLHLAKNKPKHLIRVHERPFLHYLLDNLMSAGITNICLVIGHKKELMEDFAREHEHEFKLTLVDQFAKLGTEKYGTAMPIKAAREFVGNEEFLALYGDNLYSPKDITALAAKHDGYEYLSVIESAHPEKYGVILTNNDTVTDWIEKPQQFVSNLINTGFYKFTPEIFSSIENISISLRGEYELTDAIKKLAKQSKVKARKLQDYWFDFGNPGDILKVSKFLTHENKTKE